MGPRIVERMIWEALDEAVTRPDRGSRSSDTEGGDDRATAYLHGRRRNSTSVGDSGKGICRHESGTVLDSILEGVRRRCRGVKLVSLSEIKAAAAAPPPLDVAALRELRHRRHR